MQVSRLVANEQSEHIWPAWVVQSQNSKKHQVDVEIDIGAGCSVISLYKVNELLGQEWLVQRLWPPTVRIKAYSDQEVNVIGSIILYMYMSEKSFLASQRHNWSSNIRQSSSKAHEIHQLTLCLPYMCTRTILLTTSDSYTCSKKKLCSTSLDN